MADARKRAENQKILDEYRIADIYHPQLILRDVNKVDGDILDDNLFLLRFAPSTASDSVLISLQTDIPGNFAWAKNSVNKFIEMYDRMLKEPTEAIHLLGIKKSGCRMFLESMASCTCGNSKSVDYGGMSTRVQGKPAIYMVANNFRMSVLLHEAVHNSDLRLPNDSPSFSDLDIHRVAIMMIDAQKLNSFEMHKQQITQACRYVRKEYNKGEMFVEGLTWITKIPMAELAKEKNHLGKHLKSLLATYTTAVIQEDYLLLRCFSGWEPSEHIKPLLHKYEMKGQVIGDQREKILKQQQHFWNELTKFRKDINKIRVNGWNICGEDEIDNIRDGYLKYEDICSFMTHLRAYKSAEEMFSETENKDDGSSPTLQHLRNIEDLFAKITPGDLNKNSVFAEKYLKCTCYCNTFVKKHLSGTDFKYDDQFYSPSSGRADVVYRKDLYDKLKNTIKEIQDKVKTDCAAKKIALYSEQSGAQSNGFNLRLAKKLKRVR